MLVSTEISSLVSILLLSLLTVFDQFQAVLALDFHPTVSVLASGSQDCSVKFFDYSKPSVKRSYRAIADVVGINCIHFHPSGDYMLVGTAHSTRE